MLADQDIEEGAIALQVGVGEGDQLALARRPCLVARPIQVATVADGQGGGHQQHRIVTFGRPDHQLGADRRVGRHQPTEEVGVAVRTAIRTTIIGKHDLSIPTIADEALTAADGGCSEP